MLRRIDRLADLWDARNHSGGSLVVHDAHRLDALVGVGAQLLLDRLGIGAAAPVAGDELDLEPELRRHLLPQRGEMAGLVHQHAVARRERVDERGFPGAGARRGIDHDFALRALEDALHSGEHFLADRAELRAAVVHRREIDRAQHAVGHVGRSGDLQEVAAGASGHCGILTAAPMNAPLTPVRFARAGSSSLAARLRKELDGEVLFDAASRGRYSTDASIYQVEPIGIVVPRSEEAARAAMAIAVEEGVPILPRGAGSSQCGQAVGAALIIDHTKYLNKILEIDAAGAQRARPARCGARCAERGAARARPVVSGGRLDQRAGDARRHGGQQLLRLALDRLRQHGAQRARHRRRHRRRASAGASGRWTKRPDRRVRRVRSQAEAISTSARRPRSKRAFRRCCARSPATTSITSARRTPTRRTCWSAPKARSPTPSACT